MSRYRGFLGLALLMLSYGQVLVWQETFDGPSANDWVTEQVPGSKNNPTPPAIPGLTYVTNQTGHNYFIINDANTPELNMSGAFVRGRRAECGPPNDLPNPFTSGGPVNRSLHITARASSDGAVLGYINFPDYGDEYSWSNQGFGEDGNTEQWAYYNQNISTVGKTCLRLTADFYLGGDRDRVRSYASILYSTDGGASWQVLVPNIQATINPAIWLVYHFAAGTCNNWTRLTFNLPASAENIPNLRIAFRWRNDNSFPMTTADYTLSAGFNVDNIRIEAAAPPTANFVADKTTACKYETVTFTNLTSIPCNLSTNYTWSIAPATFNYAGSTNANSVNPQVQFTANGTYTVTLTANNTAGTHTFTRTAYITVTACPPIANFTANIKGACALNPTPPPGSPTTITLTDISDLRSQPFTSRTWTITPAAGVTIAPGPGASPVTVTFTNPGTYTVQLSVTTPDGTDDTIATQILNIASCACGGASTSSVDSTVFYTQNFDGCANVTYSSNNQLSCGWRSQFITSVSSLNCVNDWRINSSEAGVTPPSCAASGGSDKSLFMGVTGNGWFNCLSFVPSCAGRACYYDGASTDKRIYLNSGIDLTAGGPYDSIVVQFDFMANGGAICGYDSAVFEYSTLGTTSWVMPVSTPSEYWLPLGNLGMFAVPMRFLETPKPAACSSPGATWARIRWRVPASAMSSTDFRIAFRWVNVNDGCGFDPSFAVDDIRIVGYKSASSFTSNQYTGPNGGSWHVAANWSANDVPDNSSEDAEIPAGKHVVISSAVEVRHVCNFGKITIDDASNVHLTVRGNLLNEGEITSTGTTSDADVRLGGADTRYRGTGTNIDADYAIISAAPGKTTLEADLSCRSLRISGGFDMSNRTVTLYRDLSYTTGTITHTGSTVLLNGPCLTCLDNNALQQISANITLNLHNLVVNKASGTVLQQAADVRINGTMTIHGGIYDAQTNQLRDGGGGPAPLVMTGGELRLARLSTTLPELSGAYTLTGGKVTLYGAGGQTLRGNRSFWDLRFENTGIKTLGGGGNTIVKSNLELALTSDYVDADANNVILWVQNPVLTAVSRTGGHVVGRLRRNIQGLGQYRFDVGSAAHYQRFDVLIRQMLAGVTHLTTRFIAQDPTDPVPAVLESGAQWQIALPPGYWQVNPDAPPTAGLYDAISYPVGFTLPLHYTLGKRPDGDGADWSQTLTGTYVAPVGGIVRRNNFSAFSEFGILTSPTPLPYGKLYLSLLTDEGPSLTWTYQGAGEVMAYRLHRSTDAGQGWNQVFVTDPSVRLWRDAFRGEAAWYQAEALMQDGSRLRSNTVEYRRSEPRSIEVTVQAVQGVVSFMPRGTEAPMQVRLWNAMGQEVASLRGMGLLTWSKPLTMTPGIYLYQVILEGQVFSGRVWIEP
jgi:PKD repeat protein